jgi:hypothetical protein
MHLTHHSVWFLFLDKITINQLKNGGIPEDISGTLGYHDCTFKKQRSDDV